MLQIVFNEISAAEISQLGTLEQLELLDEFRVSEDDLERLVREQARPGDMVVCLGAGTISAWANNLPERLMKGAA